MDTRTGDLYPSAAAALAAGVPKTAVAHVTDRTRPLQIVEVTRGPFKGRIYERLVGGGCRRRRDLEEQRHGS